LCVVTCFCLVLGVLCFPDFHFSEGWSLDWFLASRDYFSVDGWKGLTIPLALFFDRAQVVRDSRVKR
jgi:hypothetical protein